MFLACLIFGAVVLMGALLFTWRLVTHTNPPRAAVFLHALGVLGGLVALLLAAFSGPHPQNAWMAVLLLGLAGTAGGYLAFVDSKQELLQVDHVAVHAGIALSAYTALIVLTIATP